MNENEIIPVNPVTVVAEALTAFVDAAILEQVAKHVLSELGKAGVEVLDGCHRCGADASEHWCADLEETFN